MDNTPFVQQQPNDLETVFAQQSMTNPYAMLLAGATGLARRNDVDQYNAATSDYVNRALNQQASIEAGKQKAEIVKALIGQQAGLPVALQQLGADPSGAEALLNSVIGENRSKVINNVGSGAKSLLEAGVQTGIDGLSEFGIQGQNVRPLDLQKADIAGRYSVAAAAAGARERPPREIGTHSNYTADGGTTTLKYFEGDKVPDFGGSVGITSSATPEDQYLINNNVAQAANILRQQGIIADPRTATIVRLNGQVFIRMGSKEGKYGRVLIPNAQ